MYMLMTNVHQNQTVFYHAMLCLQRQTKSYNDMLKGLGLATTYRHNAKRKQEIICGISDINEVQ